MVPQLAGNEPVGWTDVGTNVRPSAKWEDRGWSDRNRTRGGRVGRKRIVLGTLTALSLVAAAPAGATPAPAQVSASPALYPSFSVGVHTYVSRCVRREPLRLSISAP